MKKMKNIIEVRDERLNDIISSDASIECVASGFRFLEGPIWHTKDHHLIFSDIMGNGLYKCGKCDVEVQL